MLARAGDSCSRLPTSDPRLPVLVEQPGVLATLSRWRSGVQIPSGTLGRDERVETRARGGDIWLLSLVSSLSSFGAGKAAKLKPS